MAKRKAGKQQGKENKKSRQIDEKDEDATMEEAETGKAQISHAKIYALWSEDGGVLSNIIEDHSDAESKCEMMRSMGMTDSEVKIFEDHETYMSFKKTIEDNHTTKKPTSLKAKTASLKATNVLLDKDEQPKATIL